MSLKVDKKCCIGCQTCTEIAPETFAMDEEGRAYVKNPKGNKPEEIQDAIDSCPVGCISNNEDE